MKGKPKNKKEMSIDKVTIDSLDTILRMCDIKLSPHTIDKIIDCVELLEMKGRETTLADVNELRAEWDSNFNNLSHDIN